VLLGPCGAICGRGYEAEAECFDFAAECVRGACEVGQRGRSAAEPWFGGRVGIDHGLCADGARAVGLAPGKGVRYGQGESAALYACRQDDQEMEHLGALRRCELVQGYRPQQRDTQASWLVIKRVT
jgi:hypothetical protein